MYLGMKLVYSRMHEWPKVLWDDIKFAHGWSSEVQAVVGYVLLQQTSVPHPGATSARDVHL